jgi:hypothetical protein
MFAIRFANQLQQQSGLMFVLASGKQFVNEFLVAGLLKSNEVAEVGNGILVPANASTLRVAAVSKKFVVHHRLFVEKSGVLKLLSRKFAAPLM